MTFFMQMVRPGETTLPLKQTANLLVSPFSGQGSMTVGEQRHALEPFDTVAVPSENWVQYRNDATEPLILFIASDEPALRAPWACSTSGDARPAAIWSSWSEGARPWLNNGTLALLAHVDCEGGQGLGGGRDDVCLAHASALWHLDLRRRSPRRPRLLASLEVPSAGIRTRCACATA